MVSGGDFSMNTRAMVNRHNTVKKSKSVCSTLLIFAIITGSFVLGLGILRFYSFRLESQLGRINDKIASYEKTISKYEQLIATLKSPSRIHSMAVSDLGMHGASSIPTITVASHPDVQLQQSDFASDEGSRNHGFARIMNFLASRASAKD